VSLEDEILRLRAKPRGRPAHADEPGRGQESVWDYPRPPRVERVVKPVRVEYAGVTVAETVRALRVCETASPPAYYVPLEDVRHGVLEPSGRTSLCEWKGVAQYWSVRVDARVTANAAWSYPMPLKGFEPLKDYVAFFAGRVDACYVGDEQVRPQPGGFYGGWITTELVGPFKGEPGTEGW